jgi:hypothetical protein
MLLKKFGLVVGGVHIEIFLVICPTTGTFREDVFGWGRRVFLNVTVF